MENQGINLKQLRGKRTLFDVSKGTGLSYSLISKMENGKLSISENSARKLSQYYGVNIPVSVVGFVQLDKNIAKQQRIDFHIKANRILHDENVVLKKKLKETEKGMVEILKDFKALEKKLANLYEIVDFINN